MSQTKWQPSQVLIDEGLVAHAISNAPTFQQTVAQPLEVLTRARDLIASGWVQHTLAVDEHGASVQPESERAVKWCVIGAMEAATYYEPESVPHAYMMKYMQTLWNAANLNYMIDVKSGNIPVVNDTVLKSHEQIVHLFDKTIAHVIKHPETNKWQPR
jgi:hypothetical protein